MKKALLLCLTLIATTFGFAQDFGTTQFATLSRNDSIIGTFYGSGAFMAAYNVSVDSDVIVLSAGYFNLSTYDINKKISIRGVGYDSASSVETFPTYLRNSGGFPHTNFGNSIYMEGVYCTADIRIKSSNIRFNKCRFNVINPDPYGNSYTQCTFTNCFITNWNSNIHSTFFTNCIILNSTSSADDIYNNCIIGISPELTNYKEIHNSITFSNDTTGIGNATNVYNTVGIRAQDTAQFYANRAGRNNQTFHSFSSIFRTFNGTYTEGETFELQDNIANTLLGSDSTQIGIYGGALPFNSRVTDPRIIGHSVDLHSNANGQINVYINLRDSNN